MLADASLSGLFRLRESLASSVKEGFHNTVTCKRGVRDNFGTNEQDQTDDSGDFHDKGCDVALEYPSESYLDWVFRL